MTLALTDDERAFLTTKRHGLVVGDPGSGKTTIALLKAQSRITEGLAPGQEILFLSFSRAAVGRLVEASRTALSPDDRSLLHVSTFHGFFWELLCSHGYLLGAPQRLRLLSPHDEAAARPDFGGDGVRWDSERERRFAQEGWVAFDLFAPKAALLLRGSHRLRRLLASKFPLIIVDEAQDTGDSQWECVKLLAPLTQLVCLADLSQQIYDYRTDVSADRIQQVMDALGPIRLDLQARNHRSPGREIVTFGNDVLLGTPRGGPYVGVTLSRYVPTARGRDSGIRSSVGRIAEAIRVAKGAEPDGIAFLTYSGRGVNLISRALTGGDGVRPIRHRVFIDEASALLSGRCIAFVLEPRGAAPDDVASFLEGAADMLKAKATAGGITQAARLRVQAQRLRDGHAARRTELSHKVQEFLVSVDGHCWIGDPWADWRHIRESLRCSPCSLLKAIGNAAMQLDLLNYRQRIVANLSDEWREVSYSQKVCKRLKAT